MRRSTATDLGFDKVLTIVAAHAKTRVGRLRLSGCFDLPDARSACRRAAYTTALTELVGIDGPLPLAGIDDAVAWLGPDAPVPSEPKQFVALLSLARRVASVRKRLATVPNELAVLRRTADELPDTTGLVATVAPLLGRDGRIPDDASPELARVRRASARQRRDVLQVLAGIQRAHRSAMTDAPPTLRRDRYCVPVRAGAKSEVPGLLLDTSATGATVFVEPFDAVELNNALAENAARERHEVQRILRLIGDAFADAAQQLTSAVEVLAELDAAQAAVLFGVRVGGFVACPQSGVGLNLVGARHPLLDERLSELRHELFGGAGRSRNDRSAVPLDFALPDGVRTLVISGPNAGGKTVVLKTIGLMVLMCYRGIPLPAAPETTVPVIDDLWCHVADEQDVSADLSTFSGAMAATASLLETATADTLVLYDELGAGTDPMEGAALGCAVLEELARRRSLTVATTHLAAVAQTASTADGFDNAAMEYDEVNRTPTYELTVGRPGRSRGLDIARRMEVSDTVLNRAEELLGGDHLELDRWLRRLETLEQELLAERAVIAEREAELAALQRDVEAEKGRLETELAQVPETVAAERDRLRRRAKRQLDRATEKLAKATRDRTPLGRKRLQKLRDEALDLGDRERPIRPARSDGPAPGARVTLSVLGGDGVVDEIRGSQISVVVGNKKIWVPIGDVEVLERPNEGQRPKRPVRLEVGDEAPREIMLLGMDAERARDEVVKALDQAFSAGARTIRIVHGHGAGILRRTVAEICREHPAVRSFKHPPGNRGGTGATEVELEESS